MNLKESGLAVIVQKDISRKSFKMCSISYICIKIHWIRWSSPPAAQRAEPLPVLAATATNLDCPSAKAELLLRSCQRADQCEALRGQRLVITKFSVALLPLPAWHVDKSFLAITPLELGLQGSQRPQVVCEERGLWEIQGDSGPSSLRRQLPSRITYG